MTDKLQAWCESVLREYYPRGLRNEIYVEYANVLAAVLRKRTDFRLVEPLPEGAIPVRIYAERNTNGVVETHAVDAASDDEVARQMVASAWGTHRSATDTFLLPIKTPTVQAEPKGVE